MKIISVRERPEFADAAIGYLSACWPEVPPVLYEDCIRHAVGAAGPLPQWYLLMSGGEPAGCAGLIANDFISRMDLWPWACALYVAEHMRGHAYGRLLLDRAAKTPAAPDSANSTSAPITPGCTKSGASAISDRAITRGMRSPGFTNALYNNTTAYAMTGKIRFGMVGTGFIADWVLAGARQDARFEAAAICSRTQAAADAFAAKHGIPHTFTSLEEMARSPLVDAVYIASPNALHASQSILCMSCGKHVLCEKPLASNAREARAMIEAARRYGVVLMEAMIATLNPNFRIVRGLLPRLGTIRRYFASYCQYSSRYDKFREGVVLNAFDPSLSNGAMMDIGVYTVYPMVALFGRPQAVEAQGVVLSSGADGQGAVNFRYEGMNATILYSKIADSRLPSEIEGEEGTLLLDAIHDIRRVTCFPRRCAASGRGPEAVGESLGVEPDRDRYYYEIAEFIDLVEQGRPESAVNSHANSLATLEIIDEVRRQLGVVYPADE